MDALQALVNLDGCASTLERLAETSIALHQDCRLAEALMFLAGSIRHQREALRPAIVAHQVRCDRAAPALVVALRPAEPDHVQQ